jgi:FAD/FMN-containing dehydrogenase
LRINETIGGGPDSTYWAKRYSATVPNNINNLVIRMHKDRESDLLPRREFLGYFAASAALIASTASSWAAQSTELEAESTARALHTLADTLEGDLLLPDNNRFEPMRGLSWNRMLPERRPEVIVMAKSQPDVVATLRFAREQSRQVAVRGGGHSWCASSLRQGGILLDLSHMRSLAIDAAQATATIGPAIQGAELIDQAARHGLMFPVAHCPTVPLSGFLLNGGNGLNFNRLGNASSNVLAIDLVLADGRELTVSGEDHADLFWAARGAGPGFFAVATRYHLKLHPLPSAITMSTYVFPESAIGTATELVDSLSATMSRDVSLILSISAPPPEIAADNDSVGVVLAITYSDTMADAEKALKPLNSDPRVSGAVSSSVNIPTELNAFLGALGATLPGGHRAVVDNIWSNVPLRTMLTGSPAHYATAPSPKSHIIAICFHPDSEFETTSYSWLGRYLVYNNTVWTDAADDDANRAWHVGATALLDPHKIGRYVGETDLTKEADVARQCYMPETWERLRALRAAYDPADLFYDYLSLI